MSPVHVVLVKNSKSAMGGNQGKINVSIKAVVYRADGTVLALRRTKTAPTRPLQWDLPGGILDYGEDTMAGIIREIKEEAGLDIKDVKILDVISAFDDKDEFWVTIGYSAHTTSDTVLLSYEHDRFQWVSPTEFGKLRASPRNKKFVKLFETAQ